VKKAGNPKPSNGFGKDKARASAAGKKSSKHLPADLKEARSMNAHDFENSLYKYMSMPFIDLQKIFKDPKTPSRDLAVISILKNAIEKGDNQRLNFLLERTIGKVKDVSEVSIKSSHKSIVEMLEDE